MSQDSSAERADRNRVPPSVLATRVASWIAGIVLAIAQIWVFRYQVSTDSISYLDMSDGVLKGSDWHRLINGVWSPLYPFGLGIARRLFSISAANEIVAAHWMNLGFFLFAFLCFEFLLAAMFSKTAVGNESRAGANASSLPRWAFLMIAYSLFLWASIHEISVRNLRPDMLMSGFLYLASGILVKMHGCSPRWKDYSSLGVILGIGVLAKEPLLPLGMLILFASLFVVNNWKAALKMSVCALVILLSLGSLYFVPLSHARGSFTFGESSRFNYLVHVNRAQPEMYLQSPGKARGSFTHSPERIFTSPPSYAFPSPEQVTYPLRFDPSDWIAGVEPHVNLKTQVGTVWKNASQTAALLSQLYLVIAGVLVLGYFSRAEISRPLTKAWPLWLVGLTGCTMYLLVHVEPRYVAGFLALFWIGIIFGFQQIRPMGNRKWVIVGAVTISVSLLFPLISRTYTRSFQSGLRPNVDAEAAAALGELGIHSGDHVARISPFSYDIAMARIARVQISAEVDFEHANEFWSSPAPLQEQLLQIFASRGAKAVIANSPELTPVNRAEWIRLGSTQYWVWLPSRLCN